MDQEILLYLKDFSLEVLVIAVIIFALTMLIKWPIKKSTSKLEENKRKAINTVIAFIPMFLAFVLSVLYQGIFKKAWFSSDVVDMMISSYLLAILIYACYSRIVYIVKGCKNNNSNELTKESIKLVKQNIKTISKVIKVDEEQLKQITSKVEAAYQLREKLLLNSASQDVPAVEQVDDQIADLKARQNQLEQLIKENNSKLATYKTTVQK